MNDVVTGVDRLQCLEQLVPLCEAIRKGSEYGVALAQAMSEVGKAINLPDRLERLEPALRLLQDASYLPTQDLVTELEKLETVGRALEQCVNTDALQEVRFSVKDAQETIKRVEAQVSRAWSELIHSKFDPLKSLGTVLTEIPDTKVTGLDIQKWATDVLNLAKVGVPISESVQQFKDALAELPARLKALGYLGVDETVRAFLLEVANNRATLENLPPSVLEWLRAKNAQARFRIELI